MKKTESILGVTALAAVSWVVFGGTVFRTEAQSAKTLTAQDILDIRGLIDSYSHILDNCTNNGNDYANLYTDDATFGVSQEYGKAKIWFRGREQLRRAGGGTDTGACRPRQEQGYSYHLAINPTIKATPTGAHAITTLLTITNDTNDRGDVVHWEGGYEDTFEKTADGWKFKSRVHVWPEVAWTDRVEDMPRRNLADE